MTDKRIKEPCPFCGNAAENIQIVISRGGEKRIECPKCHVTFAGFYYNKQNLIYKWNERYR